VTDVKFKAEHFVEIIKLCGFCSRDVISDYSQTLANVANRVLDEQLELCAKVSAPMHHLNPSWTPRRHPQDTHEGRLVRPEVIQK
jgi:hypothetical protein